MLKKTIRRLGALAMVLAMAVSVFAVNASAADATADVAMSKKVNVVGNTAAFAAEDFTFKVEYKDKSDTTPYDRPEDGAVTAEKATVGPNTTDFTDKFNLTIDESKFKGPGEYYFEISEVKPEVTTAGMTYTEVVKKLVVQIYGDGTKAKYYVVANNSEAKNDGQFVNTFSAGTLTVDKQVIGGMGDKNKEFGMTITFTAPAGTKVKNDITMTNAQGQEVVVIDAAKDWDKDNNATYTFTLKDGASVKLNNIPYGVTYAVVEDNYTSAGYTTTYVSEGTTEDSEGNKVANGTGEVNSENEAVTVKNTNETTTPGGVIMTIAPYALMVVLAGAFAVVFLSRRNRAE